MPVRQTNQLHYIITPCLKKVAHYIQHNKFTKF